MVLTAASSPAPHLLPSSALCRSGARGSCRGRGSGRPLLAACLARSARQRQPSCCTPVSGRGGQRPALPVPRALFCAWLLLAPTPRHKLYSVPACLSSIPTAPPLPKMQVEQAPEGARRFGAGGAVQVWWGMKRRGSVGCGCGALQAAAALGRASASCFFQHCSCLRHPGQCPGASKGTLMPPLPQGPMGRVSSGRAAAGRTRLRCCAPHRLCALPQSAGELVGGWGMGLSDLYSQLA